MKKGLLSILAGALLVVGCQNYDDQFDQLESQISALSSTVAGLSQVQSDLSSLAGTVSSLASTVNGLGDAIDTAVADGLSDIQADIADIEAAVQAADSSQAVSDLSAAVENAQSSLTDLLAASSVFTGDVIVNSANTLDAYLKMGAGLNIVNGNVDITVTTAMDQTKVQELVNNIFTTVKDFTYTSKASSIAETTFEKLTGTQSLTITQGGGIRFPNLTSATNIYLKDDFESTVEVIHFGSLVTVSSFNTDAEENTIRFTKAKELHLTALEYYSPAKLTIETDEGAAMPFILDDLDANGDELKDGLTLSIKGPASVDISKIADGKITLEDVQTAKLTDFKGEVVLTGDVQSFTSNSLVKLTASAGAKLETVDVTGAKDPDATTKAPSYGPSISLKDLADLETVKVAGLASAVTLSGNGNLTAATISADVAGAISISDNSDLTAITLTGAKATGLTVDSNADLAALTVDLAFRAGTGTKDVLDGSLVVTGNTSLESLKASSDAIETLTITGNTELATLDFTGVKAIGATGKAKVNIYNNNLVATKLTDTDDGTTNAANGATGDLGSITSDSGMSTLSEYLTAVAADADSTAAVYFDTVESFVKEDKSESTDKKYLTTAGATQPDEIKVLVLTAKDVETAGKAAILEKKAYRIDVTASSIADFGITIGNTVVTTDKNDTQPNVAAPAITLDQTPGIALDQIKAAATITRAAAADVTLDAFVGGSPTVQITILKTITGSANGENYSDAQGASITTLTGQSTATLVSNTNYVTLTVGSLSVTATLASLANVDTDAASEIAGAIADAWNTKYGGAGASNTMSLVDTATVNDNVITLKAKEGSGRRAHELAVKMSLTVDKATTTVTPTVSWIIGDTDATTDNKLIGKEIILTLEETKAGALGGVLLVTGTTYTLSSTLLLNSGETGVNTSTTANIYPTEARGDGAKGAGGDVVQPEGNVEEVATAAVSFSRVGWL